MKRPSSGYLNREKNRSREKKHVKRDIKTLETIEVSKASSHAGEYFENISAEYEQ